MDCLEHETSDSFVWKVQLSFTNTDGNVTKYDSEAEFSGPPEDLNQLPTHLTEAWKRILSRPPQAREMQAALDFAGQQLQSLALNRQGTASNRAAGHQVLVNVCQMLLNSNEFLYVE